MHKRLIESFYIIILFLYSIFIHFFLTKKRQIQKYILSLDFEEASRDIIVI